VFLALIAYIVKIDSFAYYKHLVHVYNYTNTKYVYSFRVSVVNKKLINNPNSNLFLNLNPF